MRTSLSHNRQKGQPHKERVFIDGGEAAHIPGDACIKTEVHNRPQTKQGKTKKNRRQERVFRMGTGDAACVRSVAMRRQLLLHGATTRSQTAAGAAFQWKVQALCAPPVVRQQRQALRCAQSSNLVRLPCRGDWLAQGSAATCDTSECSASGASTLVLVTNVSSSRAPAVY
jgi:hypothetical protein